MWKCNRCNEVFQNKLNVLKHRRKHSLYRPYKCHFGHCIKTFSSLSALQRHRRQHCDHRLYQCGVCGVGFLQQIHLVRHKCQSCYRQNFRCYSCAAVFPRILSLANHIRAQHPRCSWYRNGSKNNLKRLKKSRAAKSDDTKILLKIKAGKSMTIISPTKNPPGSDCKKRHGKKKSKKKHRKEEKETVRRGIILSIKKGTVNFSDKKIKEKSVSEKHSGRFNGLIKPEYKLSEQKSDLKLTIKTCPDLTHLNGSKEVYKLSDKDDIGAFTSSHVYVKKAHSLTDIDQIVKSGHESNRFDETDETKCRNGIVIIKDKSGKFLAEQLQSSKMKKKDRENVFDSFGDVGLWKVMPSPRTDRPLDVLKLKLSPHKPVRLEPTEDTCNYQASKYLDIPINIAKVKSDASGEDSDVMVSSPAFDKESDGGINNVNDSGIEVLSSSSCNRSNGNSVRSVALEDNSPTYFQAEDSLLSLDSPFTDNLNKSEHSICHKCGGIILEANNNTRSPGKCRCNFSNPNSPFQTPVSPLKSSAQLADTVKSQDSVYSLAHKSLSSLDNVEKGKTDRGVLCEPLSVSEKSEGEDNDVMIINPDGSVPNSDKKTRLKLKLRPKEMTASPVMKVNKKCSPKSKLNKFKSYGFVSENEKELKIKSEDLQSVHSDVPTAESTLCENSSMKHVNSSNNECNMSVVQKDTKDSAVYKQTFSDIIVIDDEDEADNCDTKQGVTVPTTCANSTPEDASHVRKKPLFKCKKQQDKSESQLVNTTKQSTENLCNNPNDKPVVKKKPLFKKRTTSADENVGTNIPVPFVKKQVSVPGTFKDVEMELFGSNSDDNHRKETSSLKNGKSPEHVSVNLKKAADGLPVTNVNEDDSLQAFPDVPIVEPPPQGVQKTPSTPLDLFQQQFLSFISNSINSNKQDMNKGLEDTASLDDSVSVNSENIVVKENANSEDKTSRETTKKPKKLAAVKSNSGKSDTQKDTKQKGSHESVCRTKSSGSKVTNKTVVKNMTGLKLGKIYENIEISEEKVENAKSDNASVDQGSGEDSKTDSFSWLKIFSSTEESGKDNSMAQEISKDVMADLSENLAEINKKMDVSEDDDTNSLDMDNVFEVGHLSSLEPKTSFQFNINKSTSSNNEILTTQSTSSHGKGKPYTRKQTAKRTIGRFKSVKRKVESDEEYCNNCSDAISDSCIHESDPEYDPCLHSDEDHVKKRNSISKGCLRSKQSHSFDSTDSENEIKSYASESERPDTDLHSSRSRRLKKGRRSCCPCCIGSPRKRLSSQTHTNTYKLPPRHKQFVRNTLRLLELQEKIHTLFLTLFPECADLIMCSKVGTDDFEVLIDEVVASLEKTSANPALQDGELNADSRIEQQYSACAINNIGMPFTTPDSASRSCEIDEKEQKTVCANVNKNVSANANLNVEANTEKASVTIEHSGTPFDTGTLWQHPSLINQTSLTSSCNSSSSLKFENNTLTDCDDYPLDEVTNDNVKVTSSSNTFTTVSQVVEGSNSSGILGNSLDNNKVSIVNNVDGVEFLESAEQYSELGYFAPVVPVPAVQNEITITLDLNAVRVTLCRSPKQCLQRLHNQIIKLSKCLLPKLMFKNYFYRNIDNLEFLLDLMLESNLHNVPVDSEDEVVFSEPEEQVTTWPDIIQNKLEILEPPLIQDTDTVQVNFFSSETNSKSEERESLFVKCSDLFEQQIKSQREFLKKDVFSVEEDRIENSDWKSTQDVLNSIHSINKMAQRRRVGRPRRDSRLRKRSADEKRTLFVQEKLLNSQNSTFVCDKPIRTRPGAKSKVGRKRMRRESSKEKFLSELNLGDIQTEITVEEKTCPSGRKQLKLSCSNNPIMVESAELENDSTTNVNDVGGTKCAELNPLDMCNELSVKVEMDSGLKSPDKNIFELMQPS